MEGSGSSKLRMMGRVFELVCSKPLLTWDLGERAELQVVLEPSECTEAM